MSMVPYGDRVARVDDLLGLCNVMVWKRNSGYLWCKTIGAIARTGTCMTLWRFCHRSCNFYFEWEIFRFIECKSWSEKANSYDRISTERPQRDTSWTTSTTALWHHDITFLASSKKHIETAIEHNEIET